MIQLDCYWYLEDQSDGEQISRAICTECHGDMAFGWYWPGKEKGYGQGTDLNCSLCKKTIYRKEVVNDSDTKDD